MALLNLQTKGKTMNKKYQKEEEFLRVLADAYLTHDAKELLDWLPDDFGYDSMWVTDSITTKERYKSYIIRKLAAQLRLLSNVEFAMMKDKRDGKPLLMITNTETPDGGHAVFVVTSDDKGNIKRLDLTSADFYPLVPMSEDNVIKRTYKTILKENKECTLRFIMKDNRVFEYRAAVLPHTIESAWGLAFVDDIPDNFGLVYDYSKIGPIDAGMYTPDTRISVDFIFADSAGKIIKIHKNAKPLSSDLIECENVSFVVELKAGQCDQNNIQTGDMIQLKSFFARDKFIGQEHPAIACMFEFGEYDFGELPKEIRSKGKLIRQVEDFTGAIRHYYLYMQDNGPAGFVMCIKEDPEENEFSLESIYPIFEGIGTQCKIQNIWSIDRTAAHMEIADRRIMHNPLAFNRLAKRDEISTINMAGWVSNIIEISNKPIVPEGSISAKDTGMTVYKCLYVDYLMNNKTGVDPNDEDLASYVEHAKLFYNTENSDSYTFMSDILKVEEFHYMGQPLYRLTVKVRKATKSKDMMDLFLYVGASDLGNHVPKVGEYIYGKCGLIGYVGDLA